MSSNILQIVDPMAVIEPHVSWLRNIFTTQNKSTAVIAVSGGIDSALSLTLLTRALGAENIHAVLLPYGNQDLSDGQAICDWNGIPPEQVRVQRIDQIVDAAWSVIPQSDHEARLRRGNLMARARMMLVFDRAKALDALVCGTENKSEHWLGYWTRFGDAASDIEPLANFYKTQVRQLAEHIELPAQIVTKAPSAGLWYGQTDESEMGFSYAEADMVMATILDHFFLTHKRWPSMAELSDNPVVDGVEPDVVLRVVTLIKRMNFKHHVPYYPQEELYVS